MFTEQLQYNQAGGINDILAIPQYNGNIASQSWEKDTLSNTFADNYDRLNRLTSGITADSAYAERNITYDQAGNIQTLSRVYGGNLTDSLVYNYTKNAALTNQVQTIQDLSADPGTTGYAAGTGSYHYDPNGNMNVFSSTNPAAKTYSTTYNLLNLPNLVHSTVSSVYEYDASGEKLSRIIDTNETDYISGIQYDNNRISFIQTEEGRVFPYSTDTSNYYQYFLADHLGNTRVAFDTPHDSLKVEQQDDYMPFGMEISQGSVANPKNEYLYNKKELQEDSQLYDYGARFYDATVGRFTTVDKLAEDPTQINLSPYAYVENDPISKDDPDGNCPSCFIGALVGAAVDYGEQVATNYVEGNAHPFTNNINLTSIGTAAVAGFVTSGGSVIENVGAKIAVKVGAALINNTVKITTSSTGLKTTVETNAVNVAKNTAIDLAADGAAGKVGGKIEGALSKVGVTNAGRLSSTAKKVVNALGQNVTRATTATVKAGLKATANVAGKTVESTVKAATNTQRDAIKDKTNKQ